MGYTTDFDGHLEITPPLTPEQTTYINDFSRTRRMHRNAEQTLGRPDPVREAVGLPVGEYGCYFVGEDGFAGQGADEFPRSIRGLVEYNSPPPGQPGLWCQWEVSENGCRLVWNGAEKFYNYIGWLEYLIEHFFKLWGRTLNGAIKWEGEDTSDIGVIYVKDNEVAAVDSVLSNPGPPWETK